MGRGDKKTQKGKRVIGSYGNKRRKNRTPLYVAPTGKKEVEKTEPVAAKEEVAKPVEKTAEKEEK